MSVYTVQATHPGAGGHSFVGCTFYGAGATSSRRWDPWAGQTLAQSAAAAAAAAAAAVATPASAAAVRSASAPFTAAAAVAARSLTMLTDAGGGDGDGRSFGDGDGRSIGDGDDDVPCNNGATELLFSCGSQVLLSGCTMVGSPLLFAGGSCNSRNASVFPVNATLLQVDSTTGTSLCAVETRVIVTGESSFDGLRLHGLVSTGGACVRACVRACVPRACVYASVPALE